MQNPIINKQPHLCTFCVHKLRKGILLISLLIAVKSFAQTHSIVVSPGILHTRYGKTAVGYTNAFIPYVSVAAGGYYAELRYNYDYDHTLGAYAGKTYYIDKDSSQSLIPQVGLLSGGITAVSVQVYYTLETKRLSIEFDNQYSVQLSKGKNIYYNWLSAGYNVSDFFSAGVSAQVYVGQGGNYNDNGLFIAFTKAGYLLTLYDFNVYDIHRHYVAIELDKDFSFGSRKNNKPNLPLHF